MYNQVLSLPSLIDSHSLADPERLRTADRMGGMTFIKKVKITCNAIKPVRERKHLPPVAGRTLKKNICRQRVDRDMHGFHLSTYFVIKEFLLDGCLETEDVGIGRSETGAPREPCKPFYASVPLE